VHGRGKVRNREREVKGCQKSGEALTTRETAREQSQTAGAGESRGSLEGGWIAATVAAAGTAVVRATRYPRSLE